MKNSVSKSNFNLFETVEMRWIDLDSLGHVNNAIIVTYFETARAKFVQKWGVSKMMFILASIKVDYIQQINYPNNLIVGQKIKKIGGKSLTIQSALFLNDNTKPAAIAEVILVAFDYEKQLSINIPNQVKEFYSKNL